MTIHDNVVPDGFVNRTTYGSMVPRPTAAPDIGTDGGLLQISGHKNRQPATKYARYGILHKCREVVNTFRWWLSSK